ncbi:MAG: hypothetical protein ACJ71T_15185 [Actinomycetales bacterium]
MAPIGRDDAALHPGQIGSASPLLFTRLVDDAAMFPPGNAPLDQALKEHVEHRAAPYAGLVGPLLVPAGRAAELVEAVGGYGFSEPVRVAFVAPAGVGQAREALATAVRDVVTTVAVELPLTPVDDLERTWAELAGVGAAGTTKRAVWWEIERDGYLREQLGRVAGAARSNGPGGAKLRTGGADAAAVPSEVELAAFLRHAIDLDLTFKLTAGLHHAVRGTDETTGLEHHGVLNILCAIKAALNGAEEDELVEVLAERDVEPLVTRTHGMSEADASVIRAFWSSYGCCGVTDPIGELATLGLLGPDLAPAGR